MLETLKKVSESNINVSIYTDADNMSKFIYGRILNVNEDEIAIYMLSPNGLFDGILVKQTSDVIRLEIDGKYHDKMEKLISPSELSQFDCSLNNKDLKNSLLSVALESKQIVSLELLNSGFNDVVGFVEENNNGQCKIKQIDEYGFEDGYSFIMVDNVTEIAYASEDEKRILQLWKRNNEARP